MTTGERTLGSRYELGELLGSGGMAEVYLGRDTRLDRDVAIKLLRDELNSDPSFITRFRREATSAASLNHHNIVAVYDTGEDDGIPYIVMEYVEGRTLRDVLRAEGPMLPRRALEVCADVCAALAFSHAAGIIHRDIKPANVMLTPNGVIKVMDFGIARAMSTTVTMTQTAAVIGTAQYLSPEQARGEHVDARSDLYSAGCLLYELVAGRAPFVGDSPVAVAYQHVREQPVAPSQLNRDIAPAVDAVVLKAMAKNPGNRYQNADEMREDLVRASAGRAVRATPLMPEETTQVIRSVNQTQVMRTNPPRPTPATRAGRGVGYALLAAALVAVFLVAGVYLRSILTNKTAPVAPPAAVPGVTGRPLAAAENLLTDAGFVVGKKETKFENSGKVPKGSVIQQDPRARVRLERGKPVNLVISDGIQTVTVPRTVGVPRAEALEELTKLGLKVPIPKIEENANAQPDTVLRTEPVAGETVNVGTTVTVVVSAGKLTVPRVVNLTQDQAQDKLEAAGFLVRFVTAFSDLPTGVVIKQDPEAATQQAPRTRVVLTVSQGASPTPTPEPTTPPPSSSEPVPSSIEPPPPPSPTVEPSPSQQPPPPSASEPAPAVPPPSETAAPTG